MPISAAEHHDANDHVVDQFFHNTGVNCVFCNG